MSRDDHWFCRLFGHTRREGYAGGKPYLTLRARTVDGIGRMHADLWAQCRYCYREFIDGHAHIAVDELVKLHMQSGGTLLVSGTVKVNPRG